MFTAIRRQLRMIRYGHCERLAATRRARLGGRPVIAVTGSAAKTTTVKLLGHLLGGPPAVGISMYANTARNVLGQFARMGPGTTCAVVEASEFPPGNLARAATTMRPTAAVLTISGFDHYTAFRGVEAVAAEMATLAHMVPADGMVVVNADDDNLRRDAVRRPTVSRSDAGGSRRRPWPRNGLAGNPGSAGGVRAGLRPL
jgi:UDP-N-acetylmuramoyl-tripeptide--D-alanyl-D-alanine ligase